MFLKVEQYERESNILLAKIEESRSELNELQTLLKDEEFQYQMAKNERDEVLKVYPCGYHQTSREGHPLYIERVGHLDVDALLKLTTIDRYIRYHVQSYEVVTPSRM